MSELETPELVTQSIERTKTISELFDLTLDIGRSFTARIDRDGLWDSLRDNELEFGVTVFDIENGSVFAELIVTLIDDNPASENFTIDDVDKIRFGIYNDIEDDIQGYLFTIEKKDIGGTRLTKRYSGITTEQLIDFAKKIKTTQPE